MQQRDERGDGHLPVERDRQVDHDHDQEGDQGLDGLGGDLAKRRSSQRQLAMFMPSLKAASIAMMMASPVVKSFTPGDPNTLMPKNAFGATPVMVSDGPVFCTPAAAIATAVP